MAPGKRIILLNGSSLLVDNSTITVSPVSSCGSSGNGVMWQGIEIHANPTVTFIDILNNSIIDKAFRGLYLATAADKNAWIYIRDSYFYNNYNAVYFIKSGVNSGPALKVRNTTFEINNGYPLTSYSRQLYLSYYNLLGLSALHFINTKNINAQGAGGLYSFNGYVNMNGGTQVGFEKGLEGIAFGGINPVLVKNFISTKSANHISVSGRRGNRFTELNITTGDRTNIPGSANNFGLKLDKTQSNIVRENDFNDLRINTSTRIGLVINQTGSEPQIIGPVNTFTNMLEAIATSYNNSGVELLCNYNTGNRKDFNCVEIKRQQGAIGAQAGNTFSTPDPFFSFTNINSGVNVSYYYGTGATEFPNSVSSNVTRIPVNAEGCPYNVPPGFSELAEIDAEYINVNNQLDSLQQYLGINHPLENEVITQIQLLEYELADLFNQAFALIQAPEEGNVDNESLILWLERVNSFESYCQIAYLHLLDRNYSQAWSVYNNIPSQFSLDSLQQFEWSEMGWMFNFMIPVFQDNRWEGELDISEISELQNFSSTSASAAGLMAKSILEFFYEIQTGELKGKKELQAEYTRIDTINLTYEEHWTISPNPSREKLNIHLTTFDPIAVYRCQLIHADGRILKEYLLKSKESQISLEEVSSGVYFLKLLKGEHPIVTDKLLVE